MTEPAYAIARTVAPRVLRHLAAHRAAASPTRGEALAPEPDAEAIEAIVDAGFWASLRHEEGDSPRISLAFLPPELSEVKLTLERSLPLEPEPLTRLAPAVENPGIHLGVWRERGELRVWGAVRTLPEFCFVLEMISPGLLVIKHSRGGQAGQFANIAVLEGDQIKVLDENACAHPDTPPVLKSLLGLDAFPSPSSPGDLLVRLATAMRAHGHGGALLVIPEKTEAWRESLVWPVRYPVAPAFSRLAELMRAPAGERAQRRWHDALERSIEAVAGLTAVDGATVITDDYAVLAFGATIGRRDHGEQVEEVLVSEPVEGDTPRAVSTAHVGGTRHQSAAQFVRDQQDALALVASKDGGFSLFAWSKQREMVQMYRIEALLL